MKDESTKAKIVEVCDRIKSMLLAKNESYGNSALEPLRIFSKADSNEQLAVRIDDKLSRLMKGKEGWGEDTILDLIGYLVLLYVAEHKPVSQFADSVADAMANRGVPKMMVD